VYCPLYSLTASQIVLLCQGHVHVECARVETVQGPLTVGFSMKQRTTRPARRLPPSSISHVNRTRVVFNHSRTLFNVSPHSAAIPTPGRTGAWRQDQRQHPAAYVSHAPTGDTVMSSCHERHVFLSCTIAGYLSCTIHVSEEGEGMEAAM
jgi:hypothetical protein